MEASVANSSQLTLPASSLRSSSGAIVSAATELTPPFMGMQHSSSLRGRREHEWTLAPPEANIGLRIRRISRSSRSGLARRRAQPSDVAYMDRPPPTSTLFPYPTRFRADTERV